MRTILLIILLVVAGVASWRHGGKVDPESFNPMNFEEGMAIGFIGSAIAAGSVAIAWACGLGELLEAILFSVLQ